ncbi:unnamed protein product [Protopolystoma xenopodis]|uniref:Uncharacterized protein n=1 Tax=Protopolystoma xenopodis TaxID=117903 RepID=A0A3S5CTN6_9PLAT|nr:unnamed protein product [Protopolystoma xenopodis]
MGTASDITLEAIGGDISLLTASVCSPSGREEPCILKRMPNSRLGISFTPKEVGEHLVSVYQAGQHIPNSPLRISVMPSEIGDPLRVHCSGSGLEHGMANQMNQFTVDTRHAAIAQHPLAQRSRECVTNLDSLFRVA